MPSCILHVPISGYCEHTLRKKMIIAQREVAKTFSIISGALLSIDPNSRPTTTEESKAFQTVAKHLWELLPDENDSYTYDSPADLLSRGSWCLQGLGNPNVVFQLGWSGISFHTSLQAAWTAWPIFASHNTDTFNSCIFPESLAWYLIRAGRHLYPMQCSSPTTPILMRETPILGF